MVFFLKIIKIRHTPDQNVNRKSLLGSYPNALNCVNNTLGMLLLTFMT